MGRIARGQLLYDGCYAHVFTRSSEGRTIFETPDDFEQLRKILKKAKAEFGFKIFHYCIMQTHFHLAVEIVDAKKFSNGMKAVKMECTHWYNQKHKRVGPLWRDRFKCKLIENDQYMYLCGQYIEDNPVRAGLVEQGEDWLYSSSRYYQSGAEDAVIDQRPGKAEEMNVAIDKVDFEKAVAIGSEWFQFKIAKKLKG